jgi:thiol:disulfide interchange protein DsbD
MDFPGEFCDSAAMIFLRRQTLPLRRAAAIFLLLGALTATAFGAHTAATLLLSADTATPGATILAGVQLEMDPGWHTYWKNPGESGQATEIKWTLPPGVTAGEIRWPLPQKLPPAEVTTYGYEDKTILLVPLTLASNVPPGPLEISAKLSWLECKEACVPGAAEVHATQNVGSEMKNSANAELLATWQKKVPAVNTFYQFHAQWENTATNNTRSFVMSNGNGTADKNIRLDAVDFFPDANDNFEVQPAIKILSAFSANLQLQLTVKKFSGDWPKEISGVLVLGTGETRTGAVVKFPITEAGAAVPTAAAKTETPASPLWLMLIYAFIGGLILNAMPCVLPVIALKILGFVGEAKSSPRRVRALGGIYTVGVLFSFLVFAAIIIGVRAAGQQAGWGGQFSSPVFVVSLTTLVLLVALNLFGVFEVTLGGGAMDAAGNLAQKSGAAGAFFNGVLATILATPCTAPFLGAALGFAFLQPPIIIILIFLTVGLGLASPYLLLSWNPAWLKFLPKPGAWMEKFKVAMGFPMLATVLWLFDVAAGVYGDKVFWLGIFLVFVAMAAWVFGDFFQRGGKRFALVITLLLLAAGYAFALEKKLNWRAPAAKSDAAAVAPGLAEGIAWQAWSPQAVAEARAAGRPVLVDFTARWCLTCNAVVKPAIADASVAAQLKALNAVALLANYSSQPAEMSKEISSHGVAGVPLVLVYPKNPALPPIVLPQPSPFQFPGQYRKVILDALALAGKM